jgi:hypothetical protein
MSPGVTGVSFISAFSFTGSPGNWERIFDFGNGPDTGNFVLSREGRSNNLVLYPDLFHSPGSVRASRMLKLQGFIKQNQIYVSVVTYVVFDATYRTNALLTLHQVHRVRLQRRSQVVGQRPFSWPVVSTPTYASR